MTREELSALEVDAVTAGCCCPWNEGRCPVCRLADSHYALRSQKEGEAVEGWAMKRDEDCSCAKAASYEFGADCGHLTDAWGKRATLIIHEPSEETSV